MKSTKIMIGIAVLMTMISFISNFNMMVGNSAGPWNLLISAIALIVWGLAIVILMRRSRNMKTVLLVVLIILIVIMIEICLGYSAKNTSSELATEILHIFTPMAFLATTPFVGAGEMVSYTGMPDMVLLEFPYIVLLLIAVITYFYSKYHK